MREDDIYDRLLERRRMRCYCAPYGKPCPECQTYADGVEAGVREALAEYLTPD